MKDQIKQRRAIAQRIIDCVLFPLRALFIPEENRYGLTSLREERFEEVAAFCHGNILDIGCGRNNLFVKTWIGDSTSTGIDVYAYEGVENVIEDMTQLPYSDNSIDTISLIAVGGHIPKKLREKEFREFGRILCPDGYLVMTEGEPITQTISHIWRHFSCALIGKKDMDSERGMEEEEEYCMPYRELMGYLNSPPLTLVTRKRFMWRLNNVYVAQKKHE